MDKPRIESALEKTVGTLTADKARQVAGDLEKNTGKLQKALGKARDAGKETRTH